MNLILTMAGKYSEFTNAGYKLPKYLLPWGNRSILSEILHELKKSNVFDNIFLIANKSDENYLNHVRKILQAYNIDSNNLILLSNTKGQAETAFSALKEIRDINGPIVFHNIDTILYNRDIKYIKSKMDQYSGYIDLFKSNNHEFSYVLVENDCISQISEKILISDKATSGLYGFNCCNTFLDNYDGEIYISDVYKKMIIKNNKIFAGKIYTEKETIVLDTPTDYLNLTKLI